MENYLLELIQSSQRILITSHISPDPDAVSSVLLLGRTMKDNYPDKEVHIVLEEKPLEDLSFLEGYNEIKFQPLQSTLEEFKPNLFAMVDAGNFYRVSRTGESNVKELLAANDIKTIVIDHHEPEGHDKVDVYINNKRPATAEEIYALLFDSLKLTKPSNYAQTALLGIISDTQRHRFDHPGYRETYRVVSQLLDDGASIEKLEARLEHYNKNQLDVFSHLAANINDSGKGYTFSYINDDYCQAWIKANKPAADLKAACEQFTNRFIRSFENNSWGFIVYPELAAGPGNWGVSFRAASGGKDVSAIARALGGGGHKPAAGAKIKTGSASEALETVIKVIEQMS